MIDLWRGRGEAPNLDSRSPGALHLSLGQPQKTQLVTVTIDFILLRVLGERITISGIWVIIPSHDIILSSVQNKNRHSPTVPLITHGISFTDDNASRDSANKGDLASENKARAASGIVDPVNH
jgi:hypothetical protein